MKRPPLRLRHPGTVTLFQAPRLLPLQRPRRLLPLQRPRRLLPPLWVVILASLVAWALWLAGCWWLAGVLYPGT